MAVTYIMEVHTQLKEGHTMKYAVLNSDNTVIAIHDNNQDV